MVRISPKLGAIPTVPQLYKNGVLKRAAGEGSGGGGAPLPSYAKHGARVGLIQGDITTLDLDAIVNAANESLLGGGGVDGAIHRAAGKQLLEECRTLKGCKTGDAKLTKGYNLPAKHVIHTVGPVYAKGRAAESREKLQSAYRRSLEEAAKAQLKSIAFPSVSTGVYGYPIDEATDVALETVGAFLDSEQGKGIDNVTFCVFSQRDHDIYARHIPLHFSP